MGSNLDAIVNSMGADDHEVLKAAVETAKAKMNKMKSGAGRSRTKEWVRKLVGPKLRFTLQEPRAFLPAVKGCTLGLVESRFIRWTGKYPTPTPPHYDSQVLRPEDEFRLAAALVLRDSDDLEVVRGFDRGEVPHISRAMLRTRSDSRASRSTF